MTTNFSPKKRSRLIHLGIFGAVYLLCLLLAHIPLRLNPGWENENPIRSLRQMCSAADIQRAGGTPFYLFDGLPNIEPKETVDAFDAIRNAIVLGAISFTAAITLVIFYLCLGLWALIGGIFTLNLSLAIGGPIFALLFGLYDLVAFPVCSIIFWLGSSFQHGTVAFHCLYIPFGLVALAAGFGGSAAGPYTVIVLIFD